jgi:hypothetical protein
MTGTPVGNNGVAIERLDVSAYTVPTDFPEPEGMEIAAGEYGYDLVYFRRMLEAGQSMSYKLKGKTELSVEFQEV